MWPVVANIIRLSSGIIFVTMRRLPADKQNNILSVRRNTSSLRKVAQQCGVGKSTAQRLCKQYLPDLPKSLGGRPAKLSPQNKHFCVRAITSGNLDTATEVKKKLENDVNVIVSDNTVRRALQEAGLDAVEKAKKPRLSSKNIRARLEFAKMYEFWTHDDWKRVIFSDESKINRFCSDGRSWCWMRDGESKQRRHVKETDKHGGGSVMVWGCMTAEGPGFMCRIVGNMDQYLYKSILEDELLQTIKWYHMDRRHVILQHDNDSKHRAFSVRQWLKAQQIEVLEWPAQSPDLNPIEHLWAMLKRNLNRYETPPGGITALWERVQAEWEKLEADECRKLVESMPRRIEAVIKAKGKWTDY